MEVFVVRLWPEDPSLRGKVEHVGSGSDGVFENGAELLDFLSDELTRPAGLPDVEVPVAE